MAQSDTALFDKWRNTKDADAFAELMSRHANMVYGACLRVVKNPGLAEDVAQESFLELMKGPGNVRSVGAWLHTVATRRALDRIKSEGRRAERETAYAATTDTVVEATWDDTREFVDEAIAALPEELRVPIVLRFLEARPQRDIAQELALSRSAVRLRIDKGIGLVRDSLEKRGVICTVAALTTLLETIPAEAAPSALLSELGKHVLASRAASGTLVKMFTVKYALGAAAALGFVSGAVWFASISGNDMDLPRATAEVVEAPVGPGPSAAPAPETAPAPPPTQSDSVAEIEEVPRVEEDTPAAGGGWKLDLTPSEEALAALKTPVSLVFQDIHLKDIMEYTQDKYGLNIILDSRVVAPPVESSAYQDSSRYVTDGYIKTLDLQDIPLEKALLAVLGPLNLTYKVRGQFIWVSTSRQITEDLTVPVPYAIISEGEILDDLASSINIEFEDIHITDLVAFLSMAFKIDIRLDAAVIPPESGPDNEQPDSARYVTNGLIVYINLKDASMGESLYALTRLLDLTYRVEKDAIFVSTKDRVHADFPALPEASVSPSPK